MDNLLKKNYDKCVGMMDRSRNPDVNGIKSGLERVRLKLVEDFGENLEFSYMGPGDKMPGVSKKSGANVYLLQVSNQKEVGVIEVIFDEKSDKIADIMGLKIKNDIPDRTDFWIFGLASLLVPLFNIYVIRKVMRSDMADKWLYYFIIIIINVGAIGCLPVRGLVFNLYKMQPFLGISFIQMGLMGSTFVIGVPLGGLYVLWLLKKGSYKKAEVLTHKKNSTIKK